jgi:dTDP-4-dehydrorhamnose reductase
VEAVSAAQFPTPAKRPINSALTSVRLAREFDIEMAPWQEALRDYLSEKGHLAA